MDGMDRMGISRRFFRHLDRHLASHNVVYQLLKFVDIFLHVKQHLI